MRRISPENAPALSRDETPRRPAPERERDTEMKRGFDRGIKNYVERLRQSGIETFESCEGGAGHAYPEPTVRFHGGSEAGWRALAVCLGHRLPITCLRRIWPVLKNEPTGPYWEITFGQRC